MKYGKLIILEGIDGSGKDTQADLLVREFGCTKTRLPLYEYDTGGLIKSWIHNSKKGISEEVFQAVMASNYIQHLDNFILPRIVRGEDVVMTRFLPSMWSYGDAFNISKSFLRNITHAVYSHYVNMLGVHSIYEVLIDIPVEDSMRRIRKRAVMTDQKVESVFENDATLKKVSEGYKNYGFDIVVDGMQKIEEVHAEIIGKLGLNS